MNPRKLGPTKINDFTVYVHCDLDLWPQTSKINRVHPLVIIKKCAKFDEDAQNGSVSIAFTRSKPDTRKHGHTDTLTDGTTEALLYPLRNALRGDKYVCETWMPLVTIKSKSVIFCIKVMVTRSLTLLSLVEYACQIWSLFLLQFKSYGQGFCHRHTHRWDWETSARVL